MNFTPRATPSHVLTRQVAHDDVIIDMALPADRHDGVGAVPTGGRAVGAMTLRAQMLAELRALSQDDAPRDAPAA